mgnify:FL=1
MNNRTIKSIAGLLGVCLTIAVLLGALSGCGPPEQEVTGQAQRDGEPTRAETPSDDARSPGREEEVTPASDDNEPAGPAPEDTPADQPPVDDTDVAPTGEPATSGDTQPSPVGDIGAPATTRATDTEPAPVGDIGTSPQTDDPSQTSVDDGTDSDTPSVENDVEQNLSSRDGGRDEGAVDSPVELTEREAAVSPGSTGAQDAVAIAKRAKQQASRGDRR